MKATSISSIVRDHKLLRDIAVGKNWNAEVQEEYAYAAAGRQVTSAWARELKVFFGVLGTAWVQDNNQVTLTDVGRKLTTASDPARVIAQQVMKYELSNPSIQRDLCRDITLVPHHVILKLLSHTGIEHISKEEFIYFVSRIRNPDIDVSECAELIVTFRALSASDRNAFIGLLDDTRRRVTDRIWPYTANFLCFPHYLEYSQAAIRVVDASAAKRVLQWYEAGHAEHIEFSTEKDWFAFYGAVASEPSAQEAIDYYRSTHDVLRATRAFRRAVERGHLRPDETETEFGCRIQGEAKLEDWLVDHLDRLETGLTFEERQYETIEAGRLDILARDQSGNYVVIELKRDKAHDAAFGQLLRYMGWVRMYLSGGGQVRGYVIGEEVDDRMVYVTLASDEINSLCGLRRYSDLNIRLVLHKTGEECFAKVEDLAAS